MQKFKATYTTTDGDTDTLIMPGKNVRTVANAMRSVVFDVYGLRCRSLDVEELRCEACDAALTIYDDSACFCNACDKAYIERVYADQY